LFAPEILLQQAPLMDARARETRFNFLALLVPSTPLSLVAAIKANYAQAVTRG
jgi:hypothetical protein